MKKIIFGFISLVLIFTLMVGLFVACELNGNRNSIPHYHIVGVFGADDLLVSTRRDASFSRSLEWGQINDTQRHHQTRTIDEDGFRPVAPVALNRDSVHYDTATGAWSIGDVTGHQLELFDDAEPADFEDRERLRFETVGMLWCETLFFRWFLNYRIPYGTPSVTAADFASYRNMMINNPYAYDWNIGDPIRYHVKWNTGAGRFYRYISVSSTANGSTDSSFIFFPLFFRSASPRDISLVLNPNQERGDNNRYSHFSFSPNDLQDYFPQEILHLPLRVAFYQHAVGSIPSQLTVFRPNSDLTGIFDGKNADDFRGDLIGSRGMGHIVPNIYNSYTWCDVVLANGNKRLQIGRTTAFDASQANMNMNDTITRIDVYIWVEGNEEFSSPIIASSVFDMNLRFYGA